MGKSIEEILQSKKITPQTKFHNYEYLYKKIVEAMEEYASAQEICVQCDEETAVHMLCTKCLGHIIEENK